MRSRAPILLGLLLAALLAGIAIWFGLESHRVSRDADRLAAESGALVAKARARTDGVDVANLALADQARTTEVINALRPALENVLSYDYKNLDATAKAVAESLSGKAFCEHDQLFAEARRAATEQRVVLTTTVREIGLTRLEPDRALALVFVDQRTTRADQAKNTASGAQLGIQADRVDGRWKITNFDLLNQPLPGGGAGFQC